MMLPNLKSLLNCCCALMLMWTICSEAEAGAFYSAGYGPSGCCGTYYAGYAPYSSGFYRVGYGGYGSWGASYVSFAAPSCCGSACGTDCFSCGGCSPCSTCCDTCGFATCGGCGIACAAGCDTGTTAPAAGSNTPNQAYSPPATGADERTYDKDGAADEEFSKPATGDRAPAGGAGSVLPPGAAGDDEDFPFNREVNKPEGAAAPEAADSVEQPIHQRQDQTPAEAEPSDAGEHENRPPAEKNADVLPVELDSRIVAGIAPQRSRVQYTVRFRVPHLARLDITPGNRWTPTEVDTRVAATK